jgi:dihydroorotase
VLSEELELATIVKGLTAGAALYGLPTPRIAPGEVANLCLIDLDARYEVGARGYASRSENCCFHGRTLHGRVLLTIAAGAVAFREHVLAEAPAVGRVERGARPRVRPSGGRNALRRARLRRG